MRRAVLRGAPGLLLAAALAGGACAQTVVGTLGAATSDRSRGVSGPWDGPVLRAGASVDLAGGAYASGLAQYQVRGGHWGRVQWLAGWSRPFGAGWAWDLGRGRSAFAGDHEEDYGEWMAGLVHRDGAVHAWWSPPRPGGRPGALYLEAGVAHRLGDDWRWLAHLGRWSSKGRGTRLDALAGVAWSHGAWEARLTLDGLLSGRDTATSSGRSGGDGSPGYGLPYRRDPGPAVVLGVTRAF